MKQDELIKNYYDAWVLKDINLFTDVFSEDCVYCECFGEEYRGSKQIYKWFEDWNKTGSILEWKIKRILFSFRKPAYFFTNFSLSPHLNHFLNALLIKNLPVMLFLLLSLITKERFVE